MITYKYKKKIWKLEIWLIVNMRRKDGLLERLHKKKYQLTPTKLICKFYIKLIIVMLNAIIQPLKTLLHISHHKVIKIVNNIIWNLFKEYIVKHKMKWLIVIYHLLLHYLPGWESKNFSILFICKSKDLYLHNTNFTLNHQNNTWIQHYKRVW
jgi:hypothetical protein